MATGNSRGQAQAFADMKIKMKDSAIQVRAFALTGRLELWNIGQAMKLFGAIMGSGLLLLELRLEEYMGIVGLKNLNGWIVIKIFDQYQ